MNMDRDVGRPPRRRGRPRRQQSSTEPQLQRKQRPPRKHRRHRPHPARQPPPHVEVKLVVRRLPPRISKEEFFEEADRRGADKAIWRAFYPGSVASNVTASVKRAGLSTRHSVAYFAFSTYAHAVALFRALNGQRFVETKNGIEYIARVERSMNQSVPLITTQRKPPAVQGTIESDTHYLAFLEEFKTEQTAEYARSPTQVGQPSDNPHQQRSTVAASSSVLENSRNAQSAQGSPTDEIGRSKAQSGGALQSHLVSTTSAITLTPLMEDVRAKRRERDERKLPKTPNTRATRRRGRRVAASAGSSNSSLPVAPAKGSVAVVAPKGAPPSSPVRKLVEEAAIALGQESSASPAGAKAGPARGPGNSTPKAVAASRSSRPGKRGGANAKPGQSGSFRGMKDAVSPKNEHDGVYVIRGPRTPVASLKYSATDGVADATPTLNLPPSESEGTAASPTIPAAAPVSRGGGRSGRGGRRKGKPPRTPAAAQQGVAQPHSPSRQAHQRPAIRLLKKEPHVPDQPSAPFGDKGS